MKISPTRVNLLNLKKELKVAERGHKLLKDKRDGLMKVFMAAVAEARRTREKTVRKLLEVFDAYVRANAMTPTSVMKAAFLLPAAEVSLKVTTKSVMSVKVAEFAVEKKGTTLSYGFSDTTGDLDVAMKGMEEVFVDLIRLAELEKKIEKMAEEIERTRRRVSALEHNRIPILREQIAFISMQLEERGRDAVVSTMRVKAMIEEKEKAAERR